MVQNYEYSFNLNNVAQIDLLKIEQTFNTLRSSFQGLSAPSSVGGQFWFGGANPKEDRLRVRNYANSDWHGVMLGDQHQRMWVYRSAAQPTMDGWVVDSTVTDTVIAIKGNTPGVGYGDIPGVVVGTWSGSDHVHKMLHNHIWTRNNVSGGSSLTYDINGVSTRFDLASYPFPKSGLVYNENNEFLTTITKEVNSYHTNNSAHDTEPAGSGSMTWRPTAAVGELQYLNLAP